MLDMHIMGIMDTDSSQYYRFQRLDAFLRFLKLAPPAFTFLRAMRMTQLGKMCGTTYYPLGRKANSTHRPKSHHSAA
jgi:hypothetical protein